MKAFIELVLKIAFHQLNKAELAKREGIPNPACELYENLTAKKPSGTEQIDRTELGQRIQRYVSIVAAEQSSLESSI